MRNEGSGCEGIYEVKFAQKYKNMLGNTIDYTQLQKKRATYMY